MTWPIFVARIVARSCWVTDFDGGCFADAPPAFADAGKSIAAIPTTNESEMITRRTILSSFFRDQTPGHFRLEGTMRFEAEGSLQEG